MTVHVLVVDDQAPFRRAMAAVVEATDGFVVVGEATSGEESLTACADTQPDLVLMDVNPPASTGSRRHVGYEHSRRRPSYCSCRRTTPTPQRVSSRSRVPLLT